MSNEVVFTGVVQSVQADSIAENAIGEVMFYRYTVRIGETPMFGHPIDLEFSKLEPQLPVLGAPVRVTVRFPDGWEVQA